MNGKTMRRAMVLGVLLEAAAPSMLMADGYERRRPVRARAQSSSAMLSVSYACPRGVQTTATYCRAYTANRPNRPVEYQCSRIAPDLAGKCEQVRISSSTGSMPVRIDCPGDLRCP